MFNTISKQNLLIEISFASYLFQQNVMISPKTNLSDYYKSLRNNVITLLEQSRRPGDQSNGKKQQERVESYTPKL